jgi:hypothetical protein
MVCVFYRRERAYGVSSTRTKVMIAIFTPRFAYKLSLIFHHFRTCLSLATETEKESSDETNQLWTHNVDIDDNNWQEL